MKYEKSCLTRKNINVKILSILNTYIFIFSYHFSKEEIIKTKPTKKENQPLKYNSVLIHVNIFYDTLKKYFFLLYFTEK